MSQPRLHHTARRPHPGTPDAANPQPRPGPTRATTAGTTAGTQAHPIRIQRASAVANAASRHAWLTVLIVGSALFAAVHRAFTATGNANFVPSLILLGSLVIPVAFVTFVAQRRLPFTVSAMSVALIATVGAVIGVVAAGILEHDVARELGVLPTVLVALIEETVKLLVPLAVLWLTSIRRLPDGLLIGVATGAGFGALETMGYTAVTYVQSPDGLAAADGMLLVRGMLSPAGHIAWTGILAVAIWSAAPHGWTPTATIRFAAVFTLVVALHTAWDTFHGLLAYTTGATISLALLTHATRRIAAPRPQPATDALRTTPHAKQQYVVN